VFTAKAELMYKVALDKSRIKSELKEKVQKENSSPNLDSSQHTNALRSKNDGVIEKRENGSNTAYIGYDGQEVEKRLHGSQMEATAICNYATFIYKYRREPIRARDLFIEGIRK
jgi:hypothetical protein